MITHRDGKPLYGDYERAHGYKEEIGDFRVGDYVEFLGPDGTGFDASRPVGEWNHRGWIWRLKVDSQEGPYAVVAQDYPSENPEFNHCFQTLIVRVFTLKCYRKVGVPTTV
jgi:hypothetical protein